MNSTGGLIRCLDSGRFDNINFDIRLLLSRYSDVLLAFVNRNCNNLANCLAKFAINFCSIEFWSNSCPNLLMSLACKYVLSFPSDDSIVKHIYYSQPLSCIQPSSFIHIFYGRSPAL
ncbi:hypothetical protein Ddye_027797 [Dipteronia dyeriana]|uniref:Uncharacterized protein n=1 Tax=Dipteronia dyeriana TaxID=168575 RepID=A0AAD9TQ88_9ROSI|nr:hypothetical protein Ddye_027797 [Dipteronia dyeriana]